MKKIKNRTESFVKECLTSMEQHLNYILNEIREESCRPGAGKLSVLEELFILAFETTRMTRTQYQEVRLIFEPEIICKSGKKYYPDFCFNFEKNYKVEYDHLKFLIELDGHIWHEKTPEQVEKDKIRERELIDNGYIILRFSGREVYRDPMKVVDECVNKYFDLVVATAHPNKN